MLKAILPFAAAALSGCFAVVVAVWKRTSPASWFFVVGMCLLALENVFAGFTLNASSRWDIAFWQTCAFLAKAVVPGVWICFSLTYSRGEHREFLRKWRVLIALAFVIPVGCVLVFAPDIVQVVANPTEPDAWLLSFGIPGQILNAALLVGTVLILANLEKTFRAAIGTMQWRIKFVVLGLAMIFGARLYSHSQALLFSGQDLGLIEVEACGLIIGCLLMSVAYARRGFSEIDVYPSHAVLQSSVTVLLAGIYLFVVGVLAHLVRYFGGAASLQLQAFVVLAAVAILATLLLSDRIRQGIHRFVSRHFKRPEHDFRNVWTTFTLRTARMLDQAGLCVAATKLVSETFNVLSVTMWIIDDRRDRMVRGSSTSDLSADHEGERMHHDLPTSAIIAELSSRRRPFDLEEVGGEWADALKKESPTHFAKGGHRFCVPLFSGERCVGLMVLADRVRGVRYSVEEFDLLKCIGDHIAMCLLNLRLTEELISARQLEAFQTMSAFFVHDLKNAASSLSLMLQNLPVHFDDPAFRADALRGIGNTVDRINHLITRLGVLRNKLDLKTVECDLNELVKEALEASHGPEEEVRWVENLQPLPKVMADREQLQNVLTNLLINAREAVTRGGEVIVATAQRNGRVVFSVTDNGCGMSPAFLRDSLFRPFHTTKKKGLGIGMFQSKMIVDAHHGDIEVESEVGKGTTFRVILPMRPHLS
jgi:putative PEP-CTERM system histidine kinase